MKRLHHCYALIACGAMLAACNDSGFDPQDPATMSVNGTLPADAQAGTTVTPSVLVRDAGGRPVAGVTVAFQVTAGGGSLSSATASTNGNGIASVPWMLGAQPGVNTVIASVPELTPITFNVTSCGVFCIAIRYVGTVSAAHEAAFNAARVRWQQIITGDLPAVPLNVGAGACKDLEGTTPVNHPAINETVDDLLVYVQVDSIDGPHGVLGSAGPCYIRNASRLPVFGVMRFDRADLNDMADEGTLGDVILHELGHVLGFPAVWKDPQFDLLEGAGTAEPYFTGAAAVSAFQLAGGTPVNGVGVPVENAGGAGTRDSHWRESILDNELMTGFLGRGSNPLSRITIASLQDVGYEVDFGAADAYTVPQPTGPRGWSAVRLEMVEKPLAAPLIVP